MVIFEGLIFRRSQVCKDFCSLIFADHQVEYSVSLSHCFFSRIKISRLTSLQQNPQNLHPSKITAYTVLLSMRIENDKITDSIIMLCVFKGLCCVIVELIVKLSPLGQSPSNISSRVRTNLGRRS